MATNAFLHASTRRRHRTGATIRLATTALSTTVDATTGQPTVTRSNLRGPFAAYIGRTVAADDRDTTDERDTETNTLTVRVDADIDVNVGDECQFTDAEDPTLNGRTGHVTGSNRGTRVHRTFTVQLTGAT